jgi:hypothetical protein
MSRPDSLPVDAVTTMRRAVAVRAILIFGPITVVVLLSFAVGVTDYAPWPFPPIFLGAFGLISLFVFTRMDRKLLLDVGKPDAPWSGADAAWLPVDTDLSPQRALRIARSAIIQLDARDIRTIGNHTVVGWVGSFWTNIPRWTAHEVAVVIIVQPDGETQLVCCARPRLRLLVGISREWASRLQQGVLSQI